MSNTTKEELPRFTIRRPGCTAWETDVRLDRVLQRLADADRHYPGHLVIDSQGEEVTLEGLVNLIIDWELQVVISDDLAEQHEADMRNRGAW